MVDPHRDSLLSEKQRGVIPIPRSSLRARVPTLPAPKRTTRPPVVLSNSSSADCSRRRTASGDLFSSSDKGIDMIRNSIFLKHRRVDDQIFEVSFAVGDALDRS